MAQTVILRPKGLYTNGNDLSAPEGSTVTADNAVCTSEGVVEPRFGLGRELNGAQPDSMAVWRDLLFGYNPGDDKIVWAEHDGSDLTDLSGTYLPPHNATGEGAHDSLVPFAEASRNLYFGTSTGIYRIDASSPSPSAPVAAGLPRGLAMSGVLSGNHGWMPGNSQAGYRVTWAYKDANNTIHEGPPSERLVVQSPRLKSITGQTTRSSTTVTVVLSAPHSLVVTQEFWMSPGDADITPPTTTPLKVISVTDAYATGTIVFTGVPVDGDTVTINGTVFTARNSPSGDSEYARGASASAAATNLLAKISAHPTISTVVSAAINTATITLTALVLGASGNAITLADSGAGHNVSGATLTGGAGPGFTYTHPTSGSANSTADFYFWPASTNTSITIPIPSGITTSHIYRVYRTRATVGNVAVPGETLDPGDEHFLVFEGAPSSAEITAGSITYLDTIPDSLLGEPLHTSPNEGTGLGPRNRPPVAYALAGFDGRLFAGNTLEAHRLNLSLLSVGGAEGILHGTTVTIAGQTYTASTDTEDASTRTFRIWAWHATTISRDGSDVVTAFGAADHGFSIGQTVTLTPGHVSGSDRHAGGDKTITGVPSTEIATYTDVGPTDASPVVHASNFFYYPFSVAKTIELTAQSLCRVINADSGNTSVYAYYTSGPDDPPGRILIEARTPGGASFAATTSARGGAWVPELPTSGTTVSSTNDRKKNALRWSELGLPEAFPPGNEILIGSADREIVRCIPVLTTVYVFKEDGLYRVSPSGGGYASECIDPTLILLGQMGAQALDNRVFAQTSKGAVSISDGSVRVLSFPVEDKFRTPEIVGSITQAEIWNDAVSSAAIEPDRMFVLCTMQSVTFPEGDAGEADANVIYTYCTATDAWTRFPLITGNTAYVGAMGNTLYVSHQEAALGKVHGYTRSGAYPANYYDDVNSFTINSATNSTTYVLASATGLSVGDTFEKTISTVLYKATVLAINGTTVTTTVPTSSAGGTTTLTTGALNAYAGFEYIVKFAPIHCGQPGMTKHFREVVILSPPCELQNAYLYFSTEVETTEEAVSLAEVATVGTARVQVPPQHQRAAWLNVRFYQKAARRKMPRIYGLAVSFEPGSERVAK